MRTILDLKMENGKQIYFNNDYLKEYEEELISFLDGLDFMKTLSFAKKTMRNREIKANNNIEGIKDELSIIDGVIRRRKTPISNNEKHRIINLFHGYQYILNNKEINKENLKELYSILSEGLLEKSDEIRMGKYYRTAPVYILKNGRLDIDPYMGVNENKLDYYMDSFFDYVNNNLNNNNEIDIFIKSQIMHFYFVYIHPYFDVNGRTSRTVSMWYLLNNKSYPYIIFNRAIAFSKSEYEQRIINARNKGNLTLFLKYLLVQVEKELEKEYVINNIEKNSSISLSKEEAQIINYLLSMNGNLTVKDLSNIYNNYNEHRKPSEIYEDKVKPMLEKNILLNTGNTKTFIKSEVPNFNIGINSSNLDLDKEKVKHLSLERLVK